MTFLNKNKKKKLKDFSVFVVKYLTIKTPPKINVLNGGGDIKTTANYDYTKKNKIININGKNRALVDIMRSIAHELSHHKQWEQNRLKIKPPDIGGVIEDEANAMAGRLIKLYAKNDSTIYGEDLDEQQISTFSPTTSSDTSTSGSDNASYPDVSKWNEHIDITRGPGNQLGVTKWSDTVGSKITRGPGNQLN